MTDGSNTVPSPFHEGSSAQMHEIQAAADRRLMGELMDLMRQALYSHPEMRLDGNGVPRFLSISQSAATFLSGSLCGEMIGMDLIDGDRKSRKSYENAAAQNFASGIRFGLQLVAKAAEKNGMVQ